MDDSQAHFSPHWNRNFKMIVTVVIMLLITLIVWRFGSLIRYLVVAGIIAFLLNPIIDLIARYFNVKHTVATLTVYLTLLAGLLTGAVYLGITGINLVEQLPTFINDTVPHLAENVATWLGQPQTFDLPFLEPRTIQPLEDIPWYDLQEQAVSILQNSVNTLVGRSGDLVEGVTKGIFSTVGFLGLFLLIYTMAIYMSLDVPRLEDTVGNMAEYSGYQQDVKRLFRDMGRIWKAYLRGQMILALIIFFVVWALMTILGVNNAFTLGVISGAFEFLPTLGPIIGAAAAILVAIFQDSNWMGLEGWQFGLLVAFIMFMVQQVENTILVPRIIGNSLDLHPLLTMIVVIMGATVAGILGAILAAPVAATFFLIGRYVWRKLFDQPPFPNEESDEEPSTMPNQIRSGVKGAIDWAGENLSKLGNKN